MKKFLVYAFYTVLFIGIAARLAAVELKPASVEQGFVEPGQAATFRFIAENGDLASAECCILDAWGNSVQSLQATYDGTTVTAAVEKLPLGFWELEFPAAQQRFGIISMPPFRETPDSFFAIDAAFSWLVHDDALREGLIKAAKRYGIGMIRERIRWGEIEPAENGWNWETNSRYDALRKFSKENGMEILELFHDAPAWIGRIERYPDDLLKTATSWETIAQRLMPTWGALEIWNEPEISFGGDLPADQYVPMVKAITHHLRLSNVSTPIFGGVMAHFEPDWLATAAHNGLLNVIDGFSFHTYDRAPSMEDLVAQYRGWLIKYGKETMPLWLTECGRPWKKGPKRPEITEDWTSAVDIAMKGIEARCCGVERYFPFVYPYYEELENNFGMMDKFGTPTRAFAAYVQSVRMLAASEYLGDLQFDNPDILRARVFGKNGEVILVLYTGKMKEQKSFSFPGNMQGSILGIAHATGEEIVPEPNGTIPLNSESMVYVRLERKSVESLLNMDTAAMKLYRPSRERRKTVYSATPVVLRYQFDKDKVTAAPQGYTIRPTKEKTLPITIRVFNLQQEQVTYPLRFSFGGSPGGVPSESRSVLVPARSFADTVWTLPLDAAELTSGNVLPVRIDIEGTDNALVMHFYGEATWDGIVASVSNVTEFPVGEMARWSKNAATICTMSMEKPESDEPAVWRMNASFGDGDRWVYPRFDIPESIDLSKGDGIMLWARCIGNATASCMLVEPHGAGYMVRAAIKNDGEWHAVKLPFERFTHVSAMAPDPNGKLDIDEVRTFLFGANCEGTDCVLELKKAALYAH